MPSGYEKSPDYGGAPRGRRGIVFDVVVLLGVLGLAAMCAVARIPAPLEWRVIDGDTDRVAFGMGTMGSRSTVIGGSALYFAADKVIDKATPADPPDRSRRPETMPTLAPHVAPAISADHLGSRAIATKRGRRPTHATHPKSLDARASATTAALEMSATTKAAPSATRSSSNAVSPDHGRCLTAGSATAKTVTAVGCF